MKTTQYISRSVFIIIIIAFCIPAFAQSPQSFKYQAIARDNTGDPLSNQNVSFLIRILEGAPNGTEQYAESHSFTTNEYGLVSLDIGDGNQIGSKDFEDIDWQTGVFFIEVSIDPNGGTAYQSLGTSQLLSVPYALHANVADSVPDDAISSNSIVDESILAVDILEKPGIAQTLNSSSVSGFTNTGVKVMDSVTVTIPGPGYIFCTARALMRFNSSNNTNEQGFIMQIDETPGGNSNIGRYSEVFLNTFPSTSIYIFDQTVTATYFKESAGTYTFYFEGMKDRDNRNITVFWPIITAIYIPSSVGTVESVISQEGNHETLGISNTNDQVDIFVETTDLRHLELKAMKARLEAEQAERALMEAKQKLEKE